MSDNIDKRLINAQNDCTRLCKEIEDYERKAAELRVELAKIAAKIRTLME